MPVMDGLEATGRIVQEPGLASRVVILTTFERDDYVFEQLRRRGRERQGVIKIERR